MRTANFYMKAGIKAFTLIELLTVIAIIGILAAIIIPSAAGVRVSANKAKTKATFSQWSLAMDLFKGDYGYYPAIGSTTPAGVSTKLVVFPSFFAAMTGKDYLGAAITPLFGNTRKLSFYSPASADVDTSGNLVDAFGNTEFAVFTDTNGDGIINAALDSLSFQPVKNTDSVARTPDIGNFDTTAGVRAGVIFYSAGKGTSAKDIVTSW